MPKGWGMGEIQIFKSKFWEVQQLLKVLSNFVGIEE